MKKILACMYGGEHGYTALRIAAKIAKGTDSKLTVIYFTERLPERYRTMFHYTVVAPGKTLADLMHGLPELKGKIFEEVDKILAEYKIKARKRMVEGKHIADAIIEESRKYDLVVLGSAGLTGIKRMLFGSISYEVSEFSDVPSLIVKRKDAELRNILICTDGSEEAEEAAFCAGAIAKGIKAKVALISVAPEYLDKKVAEKCDLESKRLLKRAFRINADTICRGGEGIKSIRSEIIKESENYDLVVCGSRGLSKLERVKMGHVSLAVKENANSNVLIVRNCSLFKKWRKKGK